MSKTDARFVISAPNSPQAQILGEIGGCKLTNLQHHLHLHKQPQPKIAHEPDIHASRLLT